MTVGVGIPESLLEEQLAGLTVTGKNLLSTLAALLDQDIAATESHIDANRGVSIYQDNCTRWMHHLEAYNRVRNIMQLLIRKESDAKKNHKQRRKEPSRPVPER